MDPDQCLLDLREAALAVLLLDDDTDDAALVRVRRADELAALFKSLDDWLSSGGFAPKAWNPTIYATDPFSGPAIPSDADPRSTSPGGTS